MATNLTVAEARKIPSLWSVADPSNPNSANFIPILNQACEAIMYGGQWKGTLGEVNFAQTDRFITLPRRWESIVADRITCRGCPPVQGRYFEFSQSGPMWFGQPENQNWYCSQNIIDQGEYPTEEVQDLEAVIRLVLTDSSDAGLSGRIYGVYLSDGKEKTLFDDNGVEGWPYTLVYPYMEIDTPVPIRVTNIVKPLTNGYVTIAAVNGSVVTRLSSYEPTEINPLYRRYKVGKWPERTDGLPVLRTLCKRRFIPVVNENDLIFPPNVRALGLAMAACKLEQQGAYEVGQSQPYWAEVWQALNAQLRQYRGNIRTPAAFVQAGSAGAIPRTR